MHSMIFLIIHPSHVAQLDPYWAENESVFEGLPQLKARNRYHDRVRHTKCEKLLPLLMEGLSEADTNPTRFVLGRKRVRF